MNYKLSDFDQNHFFEEFGIPPFKIEDIKITDSKIEFIVDRIPQNFSHHFLLKNYFGVQVDFKSFDPAEKLKALSEKLKSEIPLLDGVLDRVEVNGEKIRIEVSNDFVKERISVNGSRHKIDQIVYELFPDKSIEITASVQKAEEIPLPVEVTDTSAEKKIEKKRKERSQEGSISKITDLKPGQSCWISGKAFSFDYRNGKSPVISFGIFDGTSAIECKAFGEIAADFAEGVPEFCVISGKVQEDRFTHEPVIMVKSIEKGEPKTRMDLSPVKRVELHLHTTMSAMDGIVDPKELFELLKKWGHDAVAVTDHGVVQAFPEFEKMGEKYGIKPIYGMEAYLVDDSSKIFRNGKSKEKIEDKRYVVIDFETTGLNAVEDEIIEIGAVKIEKMQIVDQFSSLVKPKRAISQKSKEITGISSEMLENAPSAEEVMPKFFEFIEDAILVAHNADFDYRFLRESAKNLGRDINVPYIDTLQMSKSLLSLSSYGLEKVVKALSLEDFNHHRALDDASITAKVFIKLIEMAEHKGIQTLDKLNTLSRNVNVGNLRPYHLTILVKNRTGLVNLYKMVSKSHIDYFKSKPRIPRSLLEKHREGLLIGSACTSGELAQNYFGGASDDELIQMISFYDFLEVMPLDVLSDEAKDREINRDLLKNFYLKIYTLGKALSIPVVMTGDVHFLNPEDAKVRSILMGAQDYKDFEKQPSLYLRTTEEMLEAAREIFDDFENSSEICKEIVIDNTRKISDQIEKIQIVDKVLHTPKIENAENIIREETYANAKKKYGDPLPPEVDQRLERELKSIIDNGYAVLYLIAKKLVEKSRSDGYVVGSRGSVGSSLVATMLGITEVNPLPPHYYCPECHHFEFDDSKESGYDLPPKKCPVCGSQMISDGQNIPFETFMGFKGDKVPDIDLNFSGDYQSVAHKFIEELFGHDHVFRAGTISTIAERTAYGFVKGYLEKTGERMNKVEMDYYASRLTGVKRTTGQHPGGLMIVPKELDIHQFTAVQRPANDITSDVITTHFDYQSIHDTLVKLDILGHDDPTTMKMLKELTGIDPMTIPMNDPETMMIFSSLKPLKLSPDEVGTQVGTNGIPEFGTQFVKQMLIETKPQNFGDLIRISGLSHGTDVWANNAQSIIKSKKATLETVIACRDDIMIYSIKKGIENSIAFNIMEKVRKGKGLKEEEIKIMKAHEIPDWYIESCQKIRYLFPKAHAAAYVSMAFRIAYFKVHYPLAFYATYFTIKGDEFDVRIAYEGLEFINRELKKIQNEGIDNVKDKARESVLEVAKEMILRGYKFIGVDIFKSSAKRFEIENDALRVPLNKIPGLGDKVASSIEEERKLKPFTSVEDLRSRTILNKNHIQMLKEMGALKSLPEKDQITLI
ncbi:PolC-type DNA polymerase III [Athalassotoga sp.]|uniref:PolC-type DNA polymerase III n=1 Tax=Athalassotoga sp. TaxID=2022597 RepID=UPI0026B4BCB0